MDTYKTLAGEFTSEFKEKGSRFLSFAYEVETEAEVKSRLEALKNLHFKATHHCYAYRLGMSPDVYRANDDGEPSGTAGRPILGQIDSHQLTNILVVVVRYYGGIKLGVGGLRDAYKLGAQSVLSTAQTVEKICYQTYQLDFGYATQPDLMNYLKSEKIKILQSEFGEAARLQVSVRLSQTDSFLEKMKKIGGIETEPVWDTLNPPRLFF